MSKKRPIQPEMNVLSEVFLEVAKITDKMIETITGERYAFSVVVFSNDAKYACLGISNCKNIEATKYSLQKWIDGLDNEKEGKLKATYEMVFGEYTISLSHHRPETHYWIEHQSGEAIEFPQELFNKAVAEFYKENF